MDLLNCVKKHSKNKIKLAGDHSVQLFGSLPPHVQLILGGPMNEKIWNQLKDTGQIPAYLNDITLEFQEDRQLRGYIPNDTRLLEKFLAEGDAREYLAVPDAHPVPLLNEVEDETVLEALKDKFMDTLRNMHTNQELANDNLSLSTIEKRIISDSVVTEPVRTRVMSSLDPQNILPVGTRRRVRFNV